MVRDERLGSSTSGDHARHRCLNLQEAEIVEEATDVVDDLATGHEDTPRLVGQDEVEITLAVSRLLTLQPEVARR